MSNKLRYKKREALRFKIPPFSKNLFLGVKKACYAWLILDFKYLASRNIIPLLISLYILFAFL